MLDQLIEENLNSELEGIIFGNKLITDEDVSRLVFVDCIKQKEAKEFIEVFNILTNFKHTTVWGSPISQCAKSELSCINHDENSHIDVENMLTKGMYAYYINLVLPEPTLVGHYWNKLSANALQDKTLELYNMSDDFYNKYIIPLDFLNSKGDNRYVITHEATNLLSHVDFHKKLDIGLTMEEWRKLNA